MVLISAGGLFYDINAGRTISVTFTSTTVSGPWHAHTLALGFLSALTSLVFIAAGVALSSMAVVLKADVSFPTRDGRVPTGAAAGAGQSPVS